MVQRNQRGEECVHVHTCVKRSMRRYLLTTSSGRLFLTLIVLGAVMVLININFSSFVFDKSAVATHNENVFPFIADHTMLREMSHNIRPEMTREERERQERVAIFKRILHKQLRVQMKGGNHTQCIHPKLDLKHDTNQFAYFDLPPLNCTGNGMFYSENGGLVLNKSVIPDPSVFAECQFFPLTRENDNIYSYNAPESRDSPPFNISIPHDFVRVRCVLKSTVEESKGREKESHRDDDDDADVESSEQYKRRLLGKNAQFSHKPAQNISERLKLKYGKDMTKSEMFMASNATKEEEEPGNEGEKKQAEHGNGLAKMEGENTEDKEEKQAEEDGVKPAEEGEKFLEQGEGEILDEYDLAWASYFTGSDEFVDPETVWSDYDQFLVQVHPQPEVFHRIAKVESESKGRGAIKLNVLMFALDSMSHLSYQRKLPRTYRYLKEELGALIFENYNIVGDATTAAIIPMLTGQTEMDLPEVRLTKMEGGMVDEYPLIWKNFKKRGYVTLFAEDEPSLSTFNLRLNGFREQPTDHYMRTFWLALWDSSLRQSSEQFCTGTTPNHRFMLKYLEEFFLKYHNVSRFAFGFHCELSHADNNPAQYIDGDLVAFLQRLMQRKILQDTVLIIFADHGARYSKVRYTVQGKLEERLPFMSFVFPRKFQRKYPHLYKNLQTNTQRLSTPFDIHETLQDLADLSRTSQPVSSSPGISLLREIPVNRTCRDAGISMHWCTCLHLVRLDPGEEFVEGVAQALVWHLNAQTEGHREKCAVLELARVLSVHLVVPNDRVLKYRRSKDSDQRIANFSQDIDIDVAHYQVQVETKPCGAVYEATVMADFRLNSSENQFSVTPGISRINKYGDQPKCIQKLYPVLRKFCCCLDFVKTHAGNS